MKNKLFAVVFLLIIIASLAHAETIYLKDGRVVTGRSLTGAPMI